MEIDYVCYVIVMLIDRAPQHFSSSDPGDSLFPRKKRLERHWAPLKNCSTKEEGCGLKSFGEEVIEGKKILFHIFFEI